MGSSNGLIDMGVGWSDLLWVVALFLVTFTVSLLVVALLLINLPATYFLDSHVRDLWVDRHPVVRWTLHVVKNLIGLGLVLLGLLLSIPGVPGQGILTVLFGVMLLDFPGKRRLERKLASVPRVRRTIDRLRAHFGKPPLVLLEPEVPPKATSLAASQRLHSAATPMAGSPSARDSVSNERHE